MGKRAPSLKCLKMNLLFSNDKQGQLPSSWYAATVNQHKRYKTLQTRIRTDVCIIGGGFTGLSAALHLATAGVKVVLLDAHRPGWGASGRNGGQVANGQRVEQGRLEKEYGELAAHSLWQIGQDAKELVSSLVSKYSINCDFKPGIVHACFSEAEVKEELKNTANLQKNYGHSDIHSLDKTQIQNIIGSKSYIGGSIDWRSAHLHPLNFALGLADSASDLGVEIFENSLVDKIAYGNKNIIHTKPIQIIGINILSETLYSLSAKLKKLINNNNRPNTKLDIGHTLFRYMSLIFIYVYFYFLSLNKTRYKINTIIITFITI